jgi:hypothetical protein
VREFPELKGKPITVGYTSANLGIAIVAQEKDSPPIFAIRIGVRNITYNTIGHELMHLVQGSPEPHPKKTRLQRAQRIPSGEKQCDIWTLARSPLFCDDAPTYLKLPKKIRLNWNAYAAAVRRLCIAAIEKRKSYRLYIRWLEAELKKLAIAPEPTSGGNRQLALPF